MAYILRLVKITPEGERWTDLPPVPHYTRLHLDKAAKMTDEETGKSLTGGRTGIQIEVPIRQGESKCTFIHIPDDADVIYVMNPLTGDTVDTIVYPPGSRPPSHGPRPQHALHTSK